MTMMILTIEECMTTSEGKLFAAILVILFIVLFVMACIFECMNE